MGEVLSRVLSKCVHCDLPPGPVCDPCEEKIKSEHLWPCKYETNKCGVKLKRAELKVHEKNCEFGRLPCDNPYDCVTCSHPADVCRYCFPTSFSGVECNSCKEKIKEDKDWPCTKCGKKMKWARLKIHEITCGRPLSTQRRPCWDPYVCLQCHSHDDEDPFQPTRFTRQSKYFWDP